MFRVKFRRWLTMASLAWSVALGGTPEGRSLKLGERLVIHGRVYFVENILIVREARGGLTRELRKDDPRWDRPFTLPTAGKN